MSETRNLCLRFFLIALCLGFYGQVHANADLDRKYSLETVGVLRAWDNVDGLFSDYVSAAYKDYFSRQSRFVLQDISKADPILTNSKIPYNKLLEDPDILGPLARSTRSQSLIRTKIQKEGPQYHFEIAWLHSPDMEVLSRQSFVMDEPRGGRGFGAEELKALLEQSLDKTIKGVPFLGTVTGRDRDSVTLDIGSGSGVGIGDVLTIGTLNQVKRHPLLKEIMEWQLITTGKVRVVQVEDKLSFAQIIEEVPDHQIMREQKIQEIAHPPEPPAQPTTDVEAKHQDLEEPPKYGWVSAGVNLGRFARDYNSSDGTINEDGGGLAFGLKMDSEVWLTREWIGNLGLNFAFFPYSQTGTNSGGSSLGTGNLIGVKLAGGYQYLVTGDVLGPKGWAKIGYRSNSYSLPTVATSYLTPVTFTSLFVGLGADVPIYPDRGVIAEFNVGLINGVSEGSIQTNTQNFSGNSSSSSDISFSVGGYYRYTPRFTFKATFEGQFNNATFSNGKSISQKLVTLVPAVQYSF